MTTSPEILETVTSDTKSSPEVEAAAAVLITVQQVAFGTAAAMPVQVPARPTTQRPAKTGSGLLAAVRKLFLTSASDEREPRRDYPKRYAFLEDSCMARAMDRL